MSLWVGRALLVFLGASLAVIVGAAILIPTGRLSSGSISPARNSVAVTGRQLTSDEVEQLFREWACPRYPTIPQLDPVSVAPSGAATDEWRIDSRGGVFVMRESTKVFVPTSPPVAELPMPIPAALCTEGRTR